MWWWWWWWWRPMWKKKKGLRNVRNKSSHHKEEVVDKFGMKWKVTLITSRQADKAILREMHRVLEKTLQDICGAKVISKIVLNEAFHKIEITPTVGPTMMAPTSISVSCLEWKIGRREMPAYFMASCQTLYRYTRYLYYIIVFGALKQRKNAMRGWTEWWQTPTKVV